MSRDPNDHKGLIREAYRIDGISDAECRSIFMDWALSLDTGTETGQAVNALHAEYAQFAPDHPMSKILEEARSGAITRKGRRGGWRARRQSDQA